MTKIILFNTDKCPGGSCSKCEYDCKMNEVGIPKNPLKTIRISPTASFEKQCPNCQVENCILTCPQQALSLDLENNSIQVNEERCNLCGWCFDKCPAGALSQEDDFFFTYLCRLCGDQPKCVGVCNKRALTFREVDKEDRGKKFLVFSAYSNDYFVANPKGNKNVV